MPIRRGPCARRASSAGMGAYLVLAEHRVSRAQLAGLVFGDADDPLGALRWTLAQLRRSLGVADALRGDPLELGLPTDAVVDVVALASGDPDPGLVRGELLEGVGRPRPRAPMPTPATRCSGASSGARPTRLVVRPVSTRTASTAPGGLVAGHPRPGAAAARPAAGGARMEPRHRRPLEVRAGVPARGGHPGVTRPPVVSAG